MTAANRFPFKRIAVTVPPSDWFHGISRALCDIYRGELAALGLDIFDVPMDAFLLPDVVLVDRIVSDLRAFRPELAFGLHKGACALLCRLPAGRDGWRPNIFTEVLDIPTVCLWDHAPLELADQLLAPHPADPGASVAGAMAKLRRSLTHPRLMHWSPDTGQTRIMRELGFQLPDRVIEEPLPALPGFAAQGTSEVRQGSVAFVGHLYQEPVTYPHRALKGLAENVVRTWVHAASRPLWNVLSDQIGGMDAGLRKRLALDFDQTYFWHFAHRLVLHDAQTALRLHILGSAGVPVTCYGNVDTEQPGVPKNLIPVHVHIPYGPELAACLSRHTIVIDVFNPGAIRGFSHKPMITFASGGFMLVNRKDDFIAAFGDVGEAVSYDPESGDLAAKIDHFLSNPRYLREVGDAIRATISTRFQLKDVLARVMEAAFDRAGESGDVSYGARLGERSAAIANLLPRIQSWRKWTAASVRHSDGKALVVCRRQWEWAAMIAIPKSAKELREPHLRISILVEAGRIGVAVLLDTGKLIEEQHVSATEHAVSLTVELPTEGASKVILRSSASVASRAMVIEATLCDRSPRPA